MADVTLTAFVLDQLTALGDVTARRMFGGTGLYLDGRMFGIVYAGRAYLKVDDRTRPRYEDAGMGPFQPNERQTLKTYHEVPPDVLDDAATFTDWARDAVAAAKAQ